MTKDLHKGEQWNIDFIEIKEYANETGWTVDDYIAWDTTMYNIGSMYFYDEDGNQATYRQGSFEIDGLDPIPFEWDVHGPPSSDDMPDLYLLFDGTWRQFEQGQEVKLTILEGEESKYKFYVGFGYIGGGGFQFIYHIQLSH